MKKRKLLAALLCATTVVMSLAACGGSSSNSESESETTSADAKYTVGICQLVQHEALDAATEGFKAALVEKLGDEVTFDEQNAAGDSATCATITNGFVSSGYDLIMANATASLAAASASTGDIPIVATSITDYATALNIDAEDWTGVSGINVTGTSDLAPLDQQADMVNELFGDDIKTVGILYCSGEANSQYQAKTITGYLEEYGYTVKDFTFSDSNDVAQVTQACCDESDVIYIPTDNTAANCIQNINNIASAAQKPIIAGEEGICAGGGVATLSIDYYDIGYSAGLMAYEILANGGDPADMEIRYAEEVKKEYNPEICETLGITVPSDYEAIETE
ncbi:MAG: ABC transporter substrate-binding protein [Lachnospiraceae bacterium]|nr:ABC transporter substrate-binding protein [Lachnospiraceae bacterium]